MNPDFALSLHFNCSGDFNADDLVKLARNIGARAVSFSQQTAAITTACTKYTIHELASHPDAQPLTTAAIHTMLHRRQQGLTTCFTVPVTSDGQLTADTQQVLAEINRWMHLFGHAFNEGMPTTLTANTGCMFENRHFSYQKHLVIAQPWPHQIQINGLTQAPDRIELIADRTPLTFSFAAGVLTLTVPAALTLPWQVIRIQGHRPEDDWEETTF
ncbi:MAG: hypothetical protein L0I02_02700 [Lactobacillus sp.]|nr:hypothetical protein [Lactobacillus sp.]MDN6053033.1 hypothetical protein [Lactobacillus sp.]